MLYMSTKMLGLPPKITKMLDNAHHTEAFSSLFQREKKKHDWVVFEKQQCIHGFNTEKKIVFRKRLF